MHHDDQALDITAWPAEIMGGVAGQPSFAIVAVHPDVLISDFSRRLILHFSTHGLRRAGLLRPCSLGHSLSLRQLGVPSATSAWATSAWAAEVDGRVGGGLAAAGVTCQNARGAWCPSPASAPGNQEPRTLPPRPTGMKRMAVLVLAAAAAAGTSIGNSGGFRLTVHSGSLDVTITATGTPGNA